MARSLKSYAGSRAPAPPGEDQGASQQPLGGSRAEALRRLQMGAIGVVAVLLLIGLASIIKERAAQTETTSVAGAAPTSPPTTESAAADPLAEAGVVPDIPASPAPDPAAPQNADTGGATAPAAVPGAR